MKSWIGTMLQLQQLGDEDEAPAGSPPDADDLESVFGAAVTGIYQDDNGLHYTILFMPPSS